FAGCVENGDKHVALGEIAMQLAEPNGLEPQQQGRIKLLVVLIGAPASPKQRRQQAAQVSTNSAGGGCHSQFLMRFIATTSLATNCAVMATESPGFTMKLPSATMSFKSIAGSG